MLQHEATLSVNRYGRDVALVLPVGAFILPAKGARRVALGILTITEDDHNEDLLFDGSLSFASGDRE